MNFIEMAGGRKNILVWGLIILNFYLVVTNNIHAIEFMGWSAAIAGIGVGGNIASKLADNAKGDPTATFTTTETPTTTVTKSEIPTNIKDEV